MLKKVYIKPNKSIIKHWINTLIPEYDVFFFKDITNIKEIDNNLISIDEYLKTFSNIKYINAYEHWNVKNTAKYVYVDYTNNVLSNESIRNYFYEQQIECERGLVLDDVNRNLNKYFYKDKIILTNYLFANIDFKEKEEIVIQYAKSCDDWFGYVCCDMPMYIKKIANKFVNEDGCNCLSTTIYGATKDETVLFEWMNEECFLKRLVDLKYEKINDNYQTGDIIVFENDGKIIHACYCFCNELFLNKSGQSKFNPIVLLPFKNILNDWSNCKYFIYRKRNTI